jgi:uncharacterized membrane protein
MFEVLVLAVAIAALIFALRAHGLAKDLLARLAELERLVRQPPVVATAESQIAREVTPEPVPRQEPSPTDEAAPTLQPVEPPLPEAAMAASSATADEASSPEATATPASPSMEERIGTRWVVWIGGLTLALGGLFLVKYSIDRGLLSAGVRVVLGGLFALVLLGLGEWSRRKEALAEIAPLPIANIPAILTAAGTIVAFGTVYVSYALYDFLAPGLAFLLLGLVAIGTLAAALLHGPVLAGLGVAGAFVTPLLVSSSAPDYWSLYIYLAVVTAASFGLARMRLWRWLAITTIAFAFLWALPCLPCGVAFAPHAFHAIAGFLLAAVLVVSGLLFGPEAEPGKIEPISSIAIAVYALIAALLAMAEHHSDASLAVFALVTALTLAVAWRAEAATAAVAASAGLVALVFLSWLVQSAPDVLVLPGGALPGMGGALTDASVNAHLIAALLFGVAFAAGGYVAQGRSLHATVPIIWGAAGVAVPIALLIALYARIAHLDRSVPFAIVAIALAGVFAAATEQLAKREARPGLVVATALFATGTLAALALALTFALEKGWLTIALALMSAGTAWISLQRPVPFLRSLAAILAGIVVLRIGWEPRIVGDTVGTTPIFNWLLFGYGVPALSFWTGARLLRRRADDAPLRSLEAAAILFTVLLVTLQIRHFVNGGDVYADTASLAEAGLQVSALLAMAIGLERLSVRSGSIIHNIGALVLTGLAAAGVLFGLLGLEMPMLTGDPVGGRFVNLILLGYAAPAVLALLLSYAVTDHRPKAYGNSIAAVALLLALVYVTLQVRRLFHSAVLTDAATGDAEQYAYSLSWLVFGVVLLVAGFVVRSERARLAAAVVIGLTVLKAFAIDVWTLEVMYRALSFIGLGAVLVAIGWVYQRTTLGRPVQDAPATQ